MHIRKLLLVQQQKQIQYKLIIGEDPVMATTLAHEQYAQELEILNIEHIRIMDSFSHLQTLLDEQYQLALQHLKGVSEYGPKFSVNLGLVHSVMNSVEGMIKYVHILKGNYVDKGECVSAYLMEQQPMPQSDKPIEQEEEIDEETFIANQKYSSQIRLTKKDMRYGFLAKIQQNCKSLYTIKLQSDQYDQKNQIQDSDLEKLTSFSAISVLSLRQSAITDSSIELLRDRLPNIKQIDLTGCYMVTERGVRLLAQCGLVTIRLNSMATLKESTVLEVIRHATNLNYLEVKECPCLSQGIFFDIYQVYREGESTLKWLEIISSYGIDLYINKLTYMTSQNPVEQITDTEFRTLIGEKPPTYTGIYFENCQELTKHSIDLITSKCKNLQRLALSKFINLTDRLVQDISLSLGGLACLDLTCCYNITDNALYYVAHNLEVQYLVLEKCYSITDQGLMHVLNCRARDQTSPPRKYRSLSKDRSRRKISGYVVEGSQLHSLTHIESAAYSSSNHQGLDNTGTIKLRHLNLSYCKKITDEGLSLLTHNAQNLRFLSLANCDQITDQSIQEISEYLLQLEYLNLNHCERLTDSSVSMLATRLGQRLKVLEIQWCQISQNCIRLIAENLTHLRVLNVSYCPAVHSEEVEILAKNIPKIHTIKLQSCSRISEQAFIRLASLRQLKVLCLKQCAQASDTFIKLVTTNNRGLEQLDISWCTQVTDNSMFHIAKNCYSLRHLNLNGCVQISDEGVQWLSATVSEIEYLNLTLCSRLTDASIVRVTGRMKHLKHLYMCELQKVTDVSISTLSNLDRLEQLILQGCTSITNSSLVGLLYNLQKLYQLNISQCRALEGKYLNKICQFMTNIKVLELSEIQINDQFLEELCLHCPKLAFVNLCYCNQVSDAAVLRMLEKLPRLERIDIQNTNITARTKEIIVHALNSRRMDNILLQ